MMVDVGRISELTKCSFDEAGRVLSVGAAVPINEVIEALKEHDVDAAPPSFPMGMSVFNMLHTHLLKVAHNQV